MGSTIPRLPTVPYCSRLNHPLWSFGGETRPIQTVLCQLSPDGNGGRATSVGVMLQGGWVDAADGSLGQTFVTALSTLLGHCRSTRAQGAADTAEVPEIDAIWVAMLD